ncbi:MAG TPA: iron-containing alcohol dehydrogenase, partial [Polyangiaceae bacterium]|nr:iron-containing alcohol dehydrogenase [Polyangiaceae bacterium]
MAPRPAGRVLDASIEMLPDLVGELGGSRALIITGPSRRSVDRVERALAGFEVDVFTGARRHVPSDLVVQAKACLVNAGADTLVSVGGGAATGLAKALRLEHDVGFIAVPTTYSGSEYTTLFGVTESGRKRTGRDPRVRPDVVLRDATLTRDMPLGLTVSSLLNALAHPLATLESGGAEAATQVEEAVRQLLEALEVLLVEPRSLAARELAFAASELGARAIESGVPGVHHALVHSLGGAFDLEHSVLHSVLLPHSVGALRRTQAAALAQLEHAVDRVDLAGSLFDMLMRARLPTSLAELSIEFDRLVAASEGLAPEGRALLRDAFQGRRPAGHTRRLDWGVDEMVSVAGPELSDARRVVLCIHGRGSNADAVLGAAREIAGDDAGLTLVAPQAPNGRWYAGRHHQERQSLEPALGHALGTLKAVARRILEVVPAERLVVFGFSQGACLALELCVELGLPLGAVVALSGARIGGAAERPRAPATLAGTPVLVGKSAADPWFLAGELEPVVEELTGAGCQVTVASVAGDAHGVHAQHRILARPLLVGHRPTATAGGFGAFHESEDLPGALPRQQNSPAAPAYGLVAEQVNATGFTVARADNTRSWLYRVRPTAQQAAYVPLEHPTVSNDFEDRAPEVNLSGFAPLPLPSAPTDFVDGLV